jgi:hypothetical protein
VAEPELGVRISAIGVWSSLHNLTARLTLILVPIHAGLRWRWIVSVAHQLARRARRTR